ncbi:MAG: DUF448 domain-containing protein [Alphaproteobacteria bacterium]|nr:DUF448 domain-containing protein [Alphaproteobacteria bacterium]
MIRFVADQGGMVFPDVAAKLPGRGAYVSADRDAIITAIDSGKLVRALGGKTCPDDLPAMVEQLMVKRCQEALAMGRRSGIALGGGGKIRAEAVAIGLLIADDASPREARALRGDVDHDWVITALQSHEIGVPFGRQALAFAAILPGATRQSRKLAEELWRLAHYRGQGRSN